MTEQADLRREDGLAQFLGVVLEGRQLEEEADDAALDFGVGRLDFRGIAPTLWADAPWRLDADQTDIPFTFIIRDAQSDEVQMELAEIALYETADRDETAAWDDKSWQPVHTFSEELGRIDDRFWVYRPTSQPGPSPTLPLSQFKAAARGEKLLLKVVFRGSQRSMFGRRDFEAWQPLVIYLAAESLPLGDSGQWYYGDTHYHSSYTNDIKEFGNPIPDTRAAGQSMGLDWLIVTDHSVDLDDKNPYWLDKGAESRWDDLGREVEAFSDDGFRILRGEEVTALGQPGKQDDTLHMLVFGTHFQKMIPGAFAKQSLLAGVTAKLADFAREAYGHLFGPVYNLGDVLGGATEQGQAVAALKGRSVREQGALAFAAHPTLLAQLPGSTWEVEDLRNPINGMQAWNIRATVHAGPEQNPFEHWTPAKTWEEGHNKQGIDLWAQMAQEKVELENPRFVLLAGTDAHGSFNYNLAWWLDWNGVRADDNALGKVRTLLYLPYRDADAPRRAPTEAEIVAAIGLGSCVITDGPVLNLGLAFNGERATLGQVMTLKGDGPLAIEVQAASTDEFGPIEKIEALYFFQDMEEVSETINFQVGARRTLAQDIPSRSGYIRLAVETTNGSDTFRCFTNPIWFKSQTTGRRSLEVRCIDW